MKNVGWLCHCLSLISSLAIRWIKHDCPSVNLSCWTWTQWSYSRHSIIPGIILSASMKSGNCIRKDEILIFATTWMNLENIMLSEVRHMEKVKEPYEFTHVWTLKLKSTNKQKLSDTDDCWVVISGGKVGGEEVERVTGIKYTVIDRRRRDFGWWTHNAIYRWCVLALNSWKWYNFNNLCHPN